MLGSLRFVCMYPYTAFCTVFLGASLTLSPFPIVPNHPTLSPPLAQAQATEEPATVAAVSEDEKKKDEKPKPKKKKKEKEGKEKEGKDKEGKGKEGKGKDGRVKEEKEQVKEGSV